MATKTTARVKTVAKATKKNLIVKAYRGDNKTLLAMNFADKSGIDKLAGFTISARRPASRAFFYSISFSSRIPATTPRWPPSARTQW
jgi:hypothetical protein